MLIESIKPPAAMLGIHCLNIFHIIRNMYVIEGPEEGHFQIRESRKRINKFHAKQDLNPLPPDHMACALLLYYNCCLKMDGQLSNN